MEISPFQPTKLLFHRDRIEASLRHELVYPISVEIDASNRCGHNCPWCSFGTTESDGYRQQNWVTFPYPRILSLLSELKACGVLSVTFTGGGEPLVHPHAAEMFATATYLGLEWGLVTNGFALTGPVAHEVATGATFARISLDAGSDATHQLTHGIRVPQYSRIVANIAALRARSSTLTIGASFCVMDQNFKEIYKAAKDVKDAGANYLEVRPTFPTDWRGDGWGQALSDIDGAKVEVDHARLHLSSPTFKVIGMTDRFDAIAAPEKPYDQCRIGPLTTVIGADGRLWHCCVQRGQAAFELGSVAERPFREVWDELFLTRDDSQIDVSKCPRCRYDNFNSIIADAFIKDGMHRDFV